MVLKSKLVSLIAAVLACLLLMTSCTLDENGASSDTTESEVIDSTVSDIGKDVDSVVSEFVELIKDGEYYSASEYYSQNIDGNYNYIKQASTGCKELLDQLYEDFKNAKQDDENWDVVYSSIQYVTSQSDYSLIDLATLYTYKSKFDALAKSKAAYMAAVDFQKLNNYQGAISKFGEVIAEDGYYAEAMTRLSECTARYIESVIGTADALAEQNDYIGALDVIGSAMNFLGNDNAQLSAKSEVYEKTYISKTISDAETVFVTPATDYEAALGIINSALQHFPNNSELLDKKTYYLAFEAVNLYYVDTVDKYCWKKEESLEDNYGGEYSSCFTMKNYTASMALYNLERKYNILRATVFGAGNFSYPCRITVWGDGKLLYKSDKLDTKLTRPFDIEVDVTGVLDLKICCETNGSGSEIGFYNLTVQKTVR